MVSTCPSNTLGNRRIAKCKGIQLFGDFLNDVAPVYMKTKDVLYKNVHCLSCNAGNVNGATSLEPVLLCPNHYIPKIMEFESPTQIIDDLRRTQTPLCNVMFKFPRGIELSHDQYKSHVCIHSDVSVCNVTGQWINYDPVLSEACGKYNLPVKVTVPGNAVPTIFRNLACYACNYNTINTDLTCGAPLDKDEVELRLHVTPSISTYKSPISTDSDSGTNKKKGPCESGQFFDAHKVTKHVYIRTPSKHKPLVQKFKCNAQRV